MTSSVDAGPLAVEDHTIRDASNPLRQVVDLRPGHEIVPASRIDEPYFNGLFSQVFLHALVNFSCRGSLETQSVTVGVVAGNFLWVGRLPECNKHRHLLDLLPGGDIA